MLLIGKPPLNFVRSFAGTSQGGAFKSIII